MNKEVNKIRVAQIMGKMIGGGVESVVMNYYKNIDREKVQFDFICDSDSTNIPYKEIESLGGKVIIVPPYQKLFSYIKELKKIFKENKYLIVHSHLNTLSVFSLCAAKLAGVPIRIAHNHSITDKNEWKRNIMKQILKPFSKIFATNYFCCSEKTGKWLFGDKTYNKGKVFLLNNAIDLDKFKYNEKIRDIKRKELGINKDTLVIGHIGRFVSVKNHKFLIDIFNEIHKINNDSVLVLAGQGPLENEIKNKVEYLNLNENVIFLGQRSDVNELYQVFDVFVLPSLYEGLPVVGVEAQACGVQCVFSGNVTKEVKILEDTIFISLNNDSKVWARKILNLHKEHLIHNTEKEMTLSGFNIKEESKKLTNKYFDIIEERNINYGQKSNSSN